VDLSANDVEPLSSGKNNVEESELQSEQGSGDICAEEGVHVVKASAAATAAENLSPAEEVDIWYHQTFLRMLSIQARLEQARLEQAGLLQSLSTEQMKCQKLMGSSRSSKKLFFFWGF
jgi:hypothetical protein